MTNITRSDAKCGDSNGFLSFEFENNPSQPVIEFSLDGGSTYSLQVATSNQFAIFENLSPGVYDIYTRWQDGSCETNLGVVTLGDQPPPVAVVTADDYICGADTGRIIFTFVETEGRASIEFSLDSGATYPLFAEIGAGIASFDSLAPGTYNLFTRWGNQDCPTSLGAVTLTDNLGSEPDVEVVDHNNECEENPDNLAFTFKFEDEPLQSSISFSLDGGANYTFNVPDNSDSLRIEDLDPGTYEIFTKWGDGNCEEDLGLYAMGIPPQVTVKANNASCGFTVGSITFFYPAYVNKENIQFSVDGGESYSHSGPVSRENTTYTNLEVGTYHVFARWSDGTCPIDLGEHTIVISNGGKPNVSVNTFSATCGEGSGVLEFTFPTHPTRTSIQFSIDGGATYPFTNSTDDGSRIIHNISPGVYNLFARWGDESCPVDLGFHSISSGVRDLPFAIILNRSEECKVRGRNITFAFENTPGQSTLEFSNDGGNTYPLRVNDDTETATFINLDPGTYHLYVRWGDGLCPVDLGMVTISSDEDAIDPPQATYTFINPSCNNNDGSISIFFDDFVDQDSIEFRLEGTDNSTYFLGARDTEDSVVFENLPADAYSLSASWGNGFCPVNLGLIPLQINVGDSGFPGVTISSTDPSCTGEQGSITFNFQDNPEEDTIEFSFNGGISYPLVVPDNSGSVTLTGFESGNYDLFARWGDGSCPTQIGVVELTDTASFPNATFSFRLPRCGDAFGEISFHFSDSPDQDLIQFSLDNGASYDAIPDNLEKITYSNLDLKSYPLWVRWGDGSCPVFLGSVDFTISNPAPEASFAIVLPSCENNNGQIRLNFEDNQDQSQIEFSLDGGITYPLRVNDALGVAAFTNLEPGIYDLYARWADLSCSISLGQADLTRVSGGPEPDITIQNPTCGNNDGRIVFSFEDSPEQSFIEFSLDGGDTYPLIVNDQLGIAAFTNIGPGIYEVFTRWGDGTCPSGLGQIDLSQVDGVPEVNMNITPPSCGEEDGIIRLTFDNNPEQNTIEFSIDGGLTYPLVVNDALGITAFTNISPGEYAIYARWGDESCPVNLGIADLTSVSGAPEVTITTITPSCGQENGRINFAFEDNPSKSTIQFSMDGGFTYPLTVNSSQGFASFIGIAPGSYTLYARWGDGSCSTTLGEVDLLSPAQAPEVVYSVSSPSCESNRVDIQLQFEDNPLQDSIQFSIDGGSKYSLRLPVSAGTGTFSDIALDVYDIYARWGDEQCPTFVGRLDLRQINEIPRAFFTLSSPSCQGNDGIIEFNFEDNPSRTHIEFSLDGGVTYPLSVEDNTETTAFSGLEPGLYELAARWSGAECPITLGFADLTEVSGGPEVSFMSNPSSCGENQGSLTLTFQSSPGRSTIEFSLDGGKTYSYASDVSTGSLSIEDLSPGLYDIYAQWDDGLPCPIRVGLADLSPTNETPEVGYSVLSTTSCTDQTGSILFSFDDHPSFSTIAFSVDGGRTYGDQVSDSISSTVITNLSPGAYEIYVRWDDAFCPLFLGTAEVLLESGNPELTFSIIRPSCGSEDGFIDFLIDPLNQAIGDSLAFSLDGGLTYPFIAPTDTNLFTIPARAPGYYEIYSRFTSGTPCPVRLGIADMRPLQGAPRVFFTQSTASCQNLSGNVTFFFEDMPDQDSLQFSLDGGNSFPLLVSDTEGILSVSDLTPAIYELYVRGGDEACPLFLGIADLTQIAGAPVATYTFEKASCGGQPGSITLSFAGEMRQGPIALSIDGGISFPYLWAETETEFQVTDLLPGAYTLVSQWTTGNQCPTPLGTIDLNPTEGIPLTFFSVSAPSSCSDQDGVITFTFEDHPSETLVSFSIDGGLSFPIIVGDNMGTYTVEGLSSGVYELYVKWGESSCPIFLGTGELLSTEGQIDVDLSFTAPMCNEANGSISFTFPDNPDHSSIEFSLDGGRSYILAVDDTVGMAAFTELEPGTYYPVARWGDTRDCPTILEFVNLLPDQGNPISFFSLSPPSNCQSSDGAITFFYEDVEGRDALQFSIDGGSTYPIFLSDTTGSYTFENLAQGNYQLYARWGNGDCPIFLGEAELQPSLDFPEVSYSVGLASCESAEGSILFTISENPLHQFVEFSLDGGRSYTYKAETSQGFYPIYGLRGGEYELYARWAEPDACPLQLGGVDLRSGDGPVITNFIANPASACDSMNGSITFFYEQHPFRSSILFSIDGGKSFPYVGQSADQEFTIEDLPSGYYDIVANWGDNSCEVVLGTANLSAPTEAPQVYYSIERGACDGDNSAITFYYSNASDQSSIAFSLDGGNTYTLSADLNQSWITWDDLPPTTYSLWVSWGDGSCAYSLGDANLAQEIQPSSDNSFLTIETLSPTCGTADGVVSFQVDSSLAVETIQVSMDGGMVWIPINDTTGNFQVDSLAAGIYEPLVDIPGITCAIQVDSLILSEQAPLVTVNTTPPACGDSLGQLTFDFVSSRYPGELRFSIDGGITYPYQGSDTSGVLVISDLPIGMYDVYATWSHRDCDTDLGVAEIRTGCEETGIRGQVWQDLDKNGVQDAGDTGISGVSLTLLNENLFLIASATTDDSGFYNFTGLDSGTYFISIVAPEGYELTTFQQGNSGQVDSDFNPLTNRSNAVIYPDSAKNTYDAGLILTSGNLNCDQNLAARKLAIQSSTFQNGAAVLAVDEDLDGESGAIGPDASISHTLQETNPWWQVDLGELSSIYILRVFNRTDCCRESLKDFHVFFSQLPISTEATVTDLQADDDVSHFRYSGTIDSVGEMPIRAVGRYLRVQLEGNTVLSLAEVEAIGCVGVQDFGTENPNNPVDTLDTESFLLKVYPVPAKDFVVVEILNSPDSVDTYTIELIDYRGRPVYGDIIAPGIHALPIEAYSRGLYVLKVQSILETQTVRLNFQ
ncbi:MAG: SdrD B-like domain-containing protein [Bacteroidota bacterium]